MEKFVNVYGETFEDMDKNRKVERAIKVYEGGQKKIDDMFKKLRSLENEVDRIDSDMDDISCDVADSIRKLSTPIIEAGKAMQSVGTEMAKL